MGVKRSSDREASIASKPRKALSFHQAGSGGGSFVFIDLLSFCADDGRRGLQLSRSTTAWLLHLPCKFNPFVVTLVLSAFHRAALEMAADVVCLMGWLGRCGGRVVHA
jgi:hypothetical protein